MYHGTPDERAELRRTVMPLNDDNSVSKPEPPPPTPATTTTTNARSGGGGRGGRARGRGRGRGRGGGGRGGKVETRKSGRSSTRAKARDAEQEEDEEEDKEEEEEERKPTTSASGSKSRKSTQPTLKAFFNAKPSSSKNKDKDTTDAAMNDDDPADSEPANPTKPNQEADPTTQFPLPHQVTSFPVVITTYEMIIKDRIHLSKYKWGQVIVDEGHRLKNMDCRLMQEVKRYESAWRMVLSGTPLQVRLLTLTRYGGWRKF